MTPKGKKALIKSLAPFIEQWMDSADPNWEDSTDIGYISNRTIEFLAELIITALEINGDSQAYMKQQDYLN